MDSTYLVLILGLLFGAYLLDTVANLLNTRHFSPQVPEELRGYYDPEKFEKSQQYLRENSRFDLITRTVGLSVTIIFILLGGFNSVDQFARSFGHGEIISGLIFGGTLMLLRLALSVPFSAYDTFVIEQKYGFNKTTGKTFVLDLIRGTLLGMILGGALFAGVIFFFENVGPYAWQLSWVIFTLFQIVLTFLAPVLIMPLFNKFTPLPEGPLKNSIDEYVKKHSFTISGVFTMDGSLRSTKANAFFTGFGKFRRLVFFDTLMQRHTNEEVMAILAHEIGHFKRGHIPKSMALSIASSAVMFYGLSLLLENQELFQAFRMQMVSVYASIVFVGILYSPVLKVFSIFTHSLSRKFEYEADTYSSETYGKPEIMIAALKKLSTDNLSHLTPHPLKVLLDYTHPPILERIRALRLQITKQ